MAVATLQVHNIWNVFIFTSFFYPVLGVGCRLEKGYTLAASKGPPTGGSWASGLSQGLKQPGMQQPSWLLRNTSVNKAAGKEVITQTAGLQKTKILHTPNSAKQCGWVPHDSKACLPCGIQPSPTAGHSSEQLGNDWAGAPGNL